MNLIKTEQDVWILKMSTGEYLRIVGLMQSNDVWIKEEWELLYFTVRAFHGC